MCIRDSVTTIPEIDEQLGDLKCPNKHQRARVEGRDNLGAQTWPWKLADGLVQSIVGLRRRLRRSHKTDCV
eukprot:4132088-Pyramimonas_sp.AAC.1